MKIENAAIALNHPQITEILQLDKTKLDAPGSSGVAYLLGIIYVFGLCQSFDGFGN